MIICCNGRRGCLICGPSSSEQALAQSNASFAGALQSSYASQLQNQNAVLSGLNASLSPTVAGGPSQQGWSPAEVSAVNTNILDTTSANYQNAQRAAQNALAGRGGGAGNANIANSGIDQQINAGIASQAAGQTSAEENQAVQANYAQGNKNYNAAVGAEEGVAGMYDPSRYGSLALSGGGQAFGEANTVSQEQNQKESEIAGLAIGAGSSILTGGLSSFGGGGNAPAMGPGIGGSPQTALDPNVMASLGIGS